MCTLVAAATHIYEFHRQASRSAHHDHETLIRLANLTGVYMCHIAHAESCNCNRFSKMVCERPHGKTKLLRRRPPLSTRLQKLAVCSDLIYGCFFGFGAGLGRAKEGVSAHMGSRNRSKTKPNSKYKGELTSLTPSHHDPHPEQHTESLPTPPGSQANQPSTSRCRT